MGPGRRGVRLLSVPGPGRASGRSLVTWNGSVCHVPSHEPQPAELGKPVCVMHEQIEKLNSFVKHGSLEPPELKGIFSPFQRCHHT